MPNLALEPEFNSDRNTELIARYVGTISESDNGRFRAQGKSAAENGGCSRFLSLRLLYTRRIFTH